MPRSKHGYLAAGLLCSLSLCGSAASQLSTPTESSARRAWEDYENVARMWSYRIHREWSTLQKGKYPDNTGDSSAVVRSNGRCVSIEETSPSDPQARECRVINSKYQFRARQARGTKGWGLTGVGDHHSIKSGAFDRLSMRDNIETGSVFAPVSFESMPVRRLMDHPCCRTTSFAQTADGVEWLFTIDHDKRPDGMRLVNSGRILFDNARHWVIKESMTENPNGAAGITTIRQTISYLPGPNDYPIIKEINGIMESDDKTYQVKLHTTFEIVSPAQPPADSEFTLTAYGIPEAALNTTSLAKMAYNEHLGAPAIAQAPATRWYWWLMMVAGALVVIGAVLFGIGRVRRAA